MKERPILMTGDMVRATLDGDKTQTRRPIKPPPLGCQYLMLGNKTHAGCFSDGPLTDKTIYVPPTPTSTDHRLKSPYGTVGDRLYVRETWARCKVAQMGGKEITVYPVCDNTTDYGGPWKPSIHMPKKYSRITLEITDVRVERLGDVDYKSAIAEGIARVNQLGITRACGWKDYLGLTSGFLRPTYSFFSLWDSIYGKTEFASQNNPYVWVYEFERVK